MVDPTHEQERRFRLWAGESLWCELDRARKLKDEYVRQAQVVLAGNQREAAVAESWVAEHVHEVLLRWSMYRSARRSFEELDVGT